MNPDLHCNHLAHSGPRWLVCTRCGAQCSRGPTGQIVSHSRYPQRQEDRQ